jgi:hypothetical protein
MWIVMHALAPGLRSRYRRIALVEVEPYVNPTANTWRPKTIRHQKGVRRIVEFGNRVWHGGTTDSCAFARGLKEAEAEVARLNGSSEEAVAELLTTWTWGGSA